MLYIMANAVQFQERAHFGRPVGKFSSTMKIALVFLEYVRDEGATDQFVIGDKVARITNCISPDNLSIRAEKLILSRSYYVPVAILMPSRRLLASAVRLEMVMHIQQSGIRQNIGNLHIPC